jgi:CRISPR/Cas system Type II protein with McrA/HNH and RuvC-like nuclease domain
MKTVRIGLGCVWSGQRLTNGQYDIDHVLPYSIWFNNDLWNLLPSNSQINGKKSDKFPSPELILKQSEIIISYWNIYEKKANELFNYQIKTSLLNEDSNMSNKITLIESLSEKAHYLISERGYSAFNSP